MISQLSLFSRYSVNFNNCSKEFYVLLLTKRTTRKMAMHLGRSLRRALSLSSTFAPAAESSLVQREVLSNQVFSLYARNGFVDGLGTRMVGRGFASGKEIYFYI